MLELVEFLGQIVQCGVVAGYLIEQIYPLIFEGFDFSGQGCARGRSLLGTLGGLFLFGAAGVLIGPIVAALFITVWELYGDAFHEMLPEARLPGDKTWPG